MVHRVVVLEVCDGCGFCSVAGSRRPGSEIKARATNRDCGRRSARLSWSARMTIHPVNSPPAMRSGRRPMRAEHERRNGAGIIIGMVSTLGAGLKSSRRRQEALTHSGAWRSQITNRFEPPDVGGSARVGRFQTGAAALAPAGGGAPVGGRRGAKGAAWRAKNRRGSAWLSKLAAGWQSAALVARWIAYSVFD